MCLFLKGGIFDSMRPIIKLKHLKRVHSRYGVCAPMKEGHRQGLKMKHIPYCGKVVGVAAYKKEQQSVIGAVSEMVLVS